MQVAAGIAPAIRGPLVPASRWRRPRPQVVIAAASSAARRPSHVIRRGTSSGTNGAGGSRCALRTDGARSTDERDKAAVQHHALPCSFRQRRCRSAGRCPSRGGMRRRRQLRAGRRRTETRNLSVRVRQRRPLSHGSRISACIAPWPARYRSVQTSTSRSTRSIGLAQRTAVVCE
jgi:hypothetical protein